MRNAPASGRVRLLDISAPEVAGARPRGGDNDGRHVPAYRRAAHRLRPRHGQNRKAGPHPFRRWRHAGPQNRPLHPAQRAVRTCERVPPNGRGRDRIAARNAASLRAKNHPRRNRIGRARAAHCRARGYAGGHLAGSAVGEQLACSSGPGAGLGERKNAS